jgi:hypothetical protein
MHCRIGILFIEREPTDFPVSRLPVLGQKCILPYLIFFEFPNTIEERIRRSGSLFANDIVPKVVKVEILVFLGKSFRTPRIRRQQSNKSMGSEKEA